MEAFTSAKAVIAGLVDGSVSFRFDVSVVKTHSECRSHSTRLFWTQQRVRQYIASRRVFRRRVVQYVTATLFERSSDRFIQAQVSFSNQALKGVPQDHTMKMLERFQTVTKAQVVEALRKHFLPVFDPATSIAVVVTAPSKSGQIGTDLTKLGYEVEQRTLHVEASEDGEEDGEDSDGSDESDSDESMR